MNEKVRNSDILYALLKSFQNRSQDYCLYFVSDIFFILENNVSSSFFRYQLKYLVNLSSSTLSILGSSYFL